MLLVVANQKGGTGKTLLATNLSVLLAGERRTVRLLDADPQGTAARWAALRVRAGAPPTVPCLRVEAGQLEGVARREAAAGRDLVVDTGGRDSRELRTALLLADRLLVPFRPSQFDLWGLERMAALAAEARGINRRLTCLAVINLASTHPRVGEVEQTRRFLADRDGLRLARAVLHERVAYDRAARQGLAVTELKPANRRAGEEMRALYHEAFHD